jgi:Na+-driven multidrug efflux pump
MIPGVSSVYVVSSIFILLFGIIKGLGLQSKIKWTAIFLFFLIQIPVQIYIAFDKKRGMDGLFMGQILNLSLINLLMVYIMISSDWKIVSKRYRKK